MISQFILVGTIYTLPTMETPNFFVSTENCGILPVTLSKGLQNKDVVEYMSKDCLVGIKGRIEGKNSENNIDDILPKLIVEKLSFLKKNDIKDTKAVKEK